MKIFLILTIILFLNNEIYTHDHRPWDGGYTGGINIEGEGGEGGIVIGRGGGSCGSESRDNKAKARCCAGNQSLRYCGNLMNMLRGSNGGYRSGGRLMRRRVWPIDWNLINQYLMWIYLAYFLNPEAFRNCLRELWYNGAKAFIRCLCDNIIQIPSWADPYNIC